MPSMARVPCPWAWDNENQWWTNFPKANLSVLHHLLLVSWAWLWLAVFVLAPLHSPWARLGLDLSPLAVCCIDTPALPWAQLCLPLRVVFFPREGKGWAAVGKGGRLQGWSWQLPFWRKWNKMVPLPGVLTFTSPPGYAPGMSGWYCNIAAPTQF